MLGKSSKKPFPPTSLLGNGVGREPVLAFWLGQTLPTTSDRSAAGRIMVVEEIVKEILDSMVYSKMI